MATKIGIAVLVIIGGLLVFISTRPESFRIERSAQVKAPVDVVFALINDFHQWALWSPYEKLDPDMKKTFEGPPAGPGASYAWSGNNKSGEGRMTILENKPGELITIKLEFTRPFSATNQTTFKLEPSGNGTRVSWIMEGKNTFMGKAMSAFMSMDKLLGKDFEQGLANLDAAAQARVQERKAASAAVP